MTGTSCVELLHSVTIKYGMVASLLGIENVSHSFIDALRVPTLFGFRTGSLRELLDPTVVVAFQGGRSATSLGNDVSG